MYLNKNAAPARGSLRNRGRDTKGEVEMEVVKRMNYGG